MPQRLPSRLRRRFLIQAALASVVLVAAITSGGAWALHVLIDARLQTQAGEFWAQRAANPGFVPAGTERVRTWFVPAGGSIEDVPPELRLAPGSHALPGFDRHLRVEARPEGSVYVEWRRAPGRACGGTRICPSPSRRCTARAVPCRRAPPP